MTFSIVARDPERDLFGVAVSTAVPCVGGVCTYAKAGVGAIASQSYVNVRLGIDGQGRVFAYSGDECVDWYGHRTGENYSVQGNMLVGKETIDAMAEAFERSQGHLSSRLLKALEAGQAAGGDKRGRESAALLVVPPEVSDLTPTVDIRVDQHPDPVAELRRIFNLLRERYRQAMEELQREQGEG